MVDLLFLSTKFIKLGGFIGKVSMADYERFGARSSPKKARAFSEGNGPEGIVRTCWLLTGAGCTSGVHRGSTPHGEGPWTFDGCRCRSIVVIIFCCDPEQR